MGFIGKGRKFMAFDGVKVFNLKFSIERRKFLRVVSELLPPIEAGAS